MNCYRLSRIKLGATVGLLLIGATAATIVSVVHDHTPNWHPIVTVVADDVPIERVAQKSTSCASAAGISGRPTMYDSLVSRTAVVDCVCVPDAVLVLWHDLVVVQVVRESTEVRKLLAALIARELFNLLLFLSLR